MDEVGVQTAPLRRNGLHIVVKQESMVEICILNKLFKLMVLLATEVTTF